MSKNKKSTYKAKGKPSKSNTSTKKMDPQVVEEKDGGKTQIIEERIERKFSLSPYFGLAVFPRSIAYNDYGLASNLFEGYNPAPVGGVMMTYKYRKRVFWGVNTSFFYASRELNVLSALNTGVFGKINFANTKSKINPYFIAGFDFYFVNVNQSKKTVETKPDSADVGFTVERSLISFNTKYVLFTPLVGPMAGVGFDVKYSKKISLFFQGTIHNSIGTSPLLKRSFPENQSVMQMVNVTGGVRMRLFKKMKFEIDSEYVHVPDLIAWLSPIEGDEMPQQILSREANFAVNLREGLKHNVQISTNSSEINIQMDQQSDSPCNVLAVLYDQFGNKLATTVPKKDGNVHFDGLDKGTYNVTFEVQPPCNEGSFSYTLNEPGTEIVSQHYTDIDKSDSLKYEIEGIVDFKDPNASKENVQIMLVDQKTKQITSRQLTSSNGKFAFKNLNPGDYKVVYEVGSTKIQSKLSYEITTNKDSLIKRVDFPFNEVKRVSDGSRLMSGRLSLSDPTVAAYKVNLDLVDKYNRVIDKSVPNIDGTFEFIDNQNEQNDIIYDLQGLRKKEENAPLPVVASVSYEPKVEEVKRLTNEAKTTAAIKSEIPVMPTIKSDLEMYKLYDRSGKVIVDEGFGFQVGAFRNMTNVNILMDKLKAEGFTPYVQAVWSNDVNTRFKTSQNYRINRVIVFGGAEENKAADIRLKLIDSGYEIIVKEHFKAVKKVE